MTTHPEKLRSFAFFRLHASSPFVAEPAERGKAAWANVLESLANLAENEDWTGGATSGRPFPILDSYLRYTYERLLLEEKLCISDNGEHAAINTGLLTRHSEEIFGLFEKNKLENQQPWVFLKWATESDRVILGRFSSPPEMADYVSSSSELVFDWRRPLKLAYDHILVDNLERFPSELSANPTRARQALDLAVAWASKRARRNFKVIVPQWYPRLREGGAQFLMPLDLTGDQRADLALVVSAVGETSYRGHTVLTLDMAYTNARLVARPDSEWLSPRAAPMPVTDEVLGE